MFRPRGTPRSRPFIAKFQPLPERTRCRPIAPLQLPDPLDDERDGGSFKMRGLGKFGVT